MSIPVSYTHLYSTLILPVYWFPRNFIPLVKPPGYPSSLLLAFASNRCSRLRDVYKRQREVWGLILDDIIQMDAPLLVFDEADKLTEPVFHYFISLYNKLEEKCGVVFLSTDYIAKRISNGLRYQKPGYKEFYSRIGRKFYELEPTDVNDVFAICSANGVTDRKDIDKVIKEASTCDFDLRRVRKSIHKVKRMTGE